MAAKKKTPPVKKKPVPKSRPTVKVEVPFEPDPRSELTQTFTFPTSPSVTIVPPPSWRKQKGNATWHGDPDCDGWPMTDFTERFVPPSESHCGQE